MTVSEAVLLGLSVVAFIYLGIVMFKPDWLSGLRRMASAYISLGFRKLALEVC